MNDIYKGCMSTRIHRQIPMGFTKLWILTGILQGVVSKKYQAHLEKVSSGLIHNV